MVPLRGRLTGKRPRWLPRPIAALAAVALTAIGLVVYHFRSTDTRTTVVPFDPRPAVQQLTTVLPPAPRHVVILVDENKSFDQIIGNTRDAPYLNRLAHASAVFTRSYGLAHPSQPNYFALFAGRLNERGDSCDASDIAPDAPNLASELFGARRSFAGYAEDLPQPGFRGCSAGLYARKHAPWAWFTNVPSAADLPLGALSRYARLPTVAFIIPNLDHDMHSASIARGDDWLQRNVAPLVAWAQRNDTLLVITFDESSDPIGNHIPTLFVGPMVRPGRYDEVVTHYRVLRTVTEFFGLAPLGESAAATPIVDCWRR